MAGDARTAALLLLVAAVAMGVYVFFQNAPEAKLYVLLMCASVCVLLVVWVLGISARHYFSSSASGRFF